MKNFFPHAATTEGITIRVAVSFLPEQSQVASGRWFWAYHVRIENGGKQTVQLLTRHWIITDAEGSAHNVDGEGVVGEQPVLSPAQSHDYVSGCPLNTPSGKMEGVFRMLRDDDELLDVLIPRFPLVAPAVAR